MLGSLYLEQVKLVSDQFRDYVVTFEWRPNWLGRWLGRSAHAQRFRGSNKTWRKYPSGKRVSRPMQEWLTDIWRRHEFDRRCEGDLKKR